jgi:hypothetical protein
MKTTKWVVVLVLVLAGALAVGAFQPVGWLFSQWPYAYSMNESAWYYFNVPSTQWRVSLPGGVWQLLSQGGTATGWNYYQWPYCYSIAAGSWFYMAVNSPQWCVNMNDSQWSMFGQAGTPSVTNFVVGEMLAMGNGDTTYSGVLNHHSIVRESVSITAGGFSLTDDGSGVLSGGGRSGAIGYGTGSWSVDFKGVPLADGTPIVADYCYVVEGTYPGL